MSLKEEDSGKEAKETVISKMPKQRSDEILQAVARAGLSAIPMVGRPLAELLGVVIAPRLNKRKDEWLEALAERLAEL
jgi:hypothetical protein